MTSLFSHISSVFFFSDADFTINDKFSLCTWSSEGPFPDFSCSCALGKNLGIFTHAQKLPLYVFFSCMSSWIIKTSQTLSSDATWVCISRSSLDTERLPTSMAENKGIFPSWIRSSDGSMDGWILQLDGWIYRWMDGFYRCMDGLDGWIFQMDLLCQPRDEDSFQKV